MGDIITQRDKYRKGWKGGLPETQCGSGSMLKNTVDQRQWLPQIVEAYEIESVADIGAGDLNWISEMSWDVEYSAYDLVPRHKSVIEFDLLNDPLPEVDCLMLLWVLNHFPYEHCEAALDKVMSSGSRYLLITDRPKWHVEQPPAMRELADRAIETLVLNEKNDRILLIELGEEQVVEEEDDSDIHSVE